MTFAQLKVQAPVQQEVSIFQQPMLFNTLPSAEKPLFGPAATAPRNLKQFFFENSKPYNNYCVDDLAFFCRLDVKLEKATRFPVYFRLGDTHYVNYLEGKTRPLDVGY